MIGPFSLSSSSSHQEQKPSDRPSTRIKRHVLCGWKDWDGCIDAFSGSKAKTDETQSRRHPWLQKSLAIDFSGLGFQSQCLAVLTCLQLINYSGIVSTPANACRGKRHTEIKASGGITMGTDRH